MTAKAATHSSLPSFLKSPWLVSFLIATLLYMILLWDYRKIPAYHDAVLNWEYATQYAANPFYPFNNVADTGHPPLIAWIVGTLSSILPISLLRMMHLASWIAAGALIASVFASTQRLFHPLIAVGVAFLTAIHPVVVSQSIQFNLDLYLTSFTWIAIYGAVIGRPWVICLGLSGAVMSKLNGGFSEIPFGFLALYFLLFDGKKFSLQRFWKATWPLAIPAAIFVVYHLAKYSAKGYLFDSGEFAGGQQLATASSLPRYLDNIVYTLRMNFSNNGNLYPIILALIGFTVFAARFFFGYTTDAPKVVRNDIDRSIEEVLWRPLSAKELVIFLWFMVLFQIFAHSIRNEYTLVRYFMLCYPAYYLTCLLAVAFAAGRYRFEALSAVIAALAVAFAVRLHPKNALETFVPNYGRWTNYELTLQFPDQIDTFRQAMKFVDKEYPTASIKTIWPFTHYLWQPSFGIVKEPRIVVEQPNPADNVIWITHSLEYHQWDFPVGPEAVPAPAGFTLVRYFRENALTWSAVYASDGALQMRNQATQAQENE